MDKLSKTFECGQVLTAAELNAITEKVDSIIDSVDTLSNSETTIKSISKVTTTYATSLLSSIPTSGWSSTIPSIKQGYYLFTKIEISYSDNTSNTSYSISYCGTNGTSTTTTTGSTDTYKVFTYRINIYKKLTSSATVDTPVDDIKSTSNTSGKLLTLIFDFTNGLIKIIPDGWYISPVEAEEAFNTSNFGKSGIIYTSSNTYIDVRKNDSVTALNNVYSSTGWNTPIKFLSLDGLSSLSDSAMKEIATQVINEKLADINDSIANASEAIDSLKCLYKWEETTETEDLVSIPDTVTTLEQLNNTCTGATYYNKTVKLDDKYYTYVADLLTLTNKLDNLGTLSNTNAKDNVTWTTVDPVDNATEVTSLPTSEFTYGGYYKIITDGVATYYRCDYPLTPTLRTILNDNLKLELGKLEDTTKNSADIYLYLSNPSSTITKQSIKLDGDVLGDAIANGDLNVKNILYIRKDGSLYAAMGTNGESKFNADGTGSLIGGAIKWGSNTDLSISEYADAISYICNYNGYANILGGKLGKWLLTSNGLQYTLDESSIYLNPSTGLYLQSGTTNYWGLKLEGSGYLAKKNLSWDTIGNITFGSVGTINADKSGYFAINNLSWDTTGAITIKNNSILSADIATAEYYYDTKIKEKSVLYRHFDNGVLTDSTEISGGNITSNTNITDGVQTFLISGNTLSISTTTTATGDKTETVIDDSSIKTSHYYIKNSEATMCLMSLEGTVLTITQIS